MKFIFLFFTALCFGQTQTRPELTAPLLQVFAQEAQTRGVDVLARLDELDSLKVAYIEDCITAEYRWRGNMEIITIDPKAFDGTNKPLFVLFHELGHHFGIPDCYKCRYNIAAGNFSERATYLSKDEILKRWLMDNYFERIQDPQAKHKHF